MYKCDHVGYDVRSGVSGGYDADIRSVRQDHGVPEEYIRDECYGMLERGGLRVKGDRRPVR